MNKFEDYLLVAHRGLHDTMSPENSMNAFELAIENKLPIELDIRLTKDNVLIVFHDENLFRMTGVDRDVCDCNYVDIKNLRLLHTNNNIPTFEEVLRLIDEKVPIMIELKNEGKVGKLEEAFIKIIKDYKGEYIVQSFNPFSLICIKKQNKSILRGQLVCHEYNNINKIKGFILKHMLLNIFVKPDYISYNIDDITNRIVKKYNKYKLFAWTVKSKEQALKCKELKMNCIFDIISADEVKEIALEK